jgi:hypothetical protein
MQQLSPPQLPRGGFWSALPGKTLRRLEAWCLNPSTAAPTPSVGSTTDSTSASEAHHGFSHSATHSINSSSSTGRNTSVGRQAQASTAPSGGSSSSSSTGRNTSVGRQAQASGSSSSSSSSSSRRRAGSAVPGSVATGRNAAVDGAQAAEVAYDEDGLRWVGPGPCQQGFLNTFLGCAEVNNP